MTFEPVALDDFGGLNLAVDPEDVGGAGAIDIKNVILDRRGRLRTRPGTASFATNTGFFPVRLGVLPSVNQLLVGWVASSNSIVRVYSSDGTLVLSSSHATGGFATIGTPTQDAVYFGVTDTGVLSWNGTAFATEATNVKPFLAAAVPYEPRLAVARTSDEPSRVVFSDAGDPGTFTYDGTADPPTGNFVDLSPGDGEAITALVGWRDKLFAFKRSQFFVFYGTSEDETGDPIFEYQAIQARVGGAGQYDNTEFTAMTSVVAARDGVYFLAYDGVYRTTGDLPVKVSQALDPWFRGETLAAASSVPTYTGDFSSASVAADSRFVYVRPEDDGNTFVLDTQSGQWSIYGLSITAAIEYSTANTSAKFTMVTTDDGVFKHGEPLTDDAGTAIDWVWQSGWYDLGYPDRYKTVRHAKIAGTGSPTVSVFTDFGSSDSNAGSVTLGTSPTEAIGTHTPAYRGRLFSHKFSGSGPVTISRFGHNIAGLARPGAVFS